MSAAEVRAAPSQGTAEGLPGAYCLPPPPSSCNRATLDLSRRPNVQGAMSGLSLTSWGVFGAAWQ
jgi:hypothetical protein